MVPFSVVAFSDDPSVHLAPRITADMAIVSPCGNGFGTSQGIGFGIICFHFGGQPFPPPLQHIEMFESNKGVALRYEGSPIILKNGVTSRWIVCPGCIYENISSAIAASSSDDTINITAGSYDKSKVAALMTRIAT